MSSSLTSPIKRLRDALLTANGGLVEAMALLLPNHSTALSREEAVEYIVRANKIAAAALKELGEQREPH